MQPTTTFLVASLANGEVRWAAIDPCARHLEGRVCDRRFPAYCAPFVQEAEARQALLEVGADPATITAESRCRRRRHG